MLRQYRPCIIAFYVFAAAALVCAAFFDLKLDIALYNPENAFAVWFRSTGEIPSRLICPVAGAFLCLLCKKRWQRVGGALLSLGGSAYLGYYLGKHFFVEENRLVFSLLYGVGFGLCLLFISRFINVPKKLKQPLIVLSLVAVAVMAAQLLLVEGGKALWGRVRFRDLSAAAGYAGFTPFYVINGFTGDKSFPSGHAAGAGMSFLAMFLPALSRNCRRYQWACFAVPFVYTGVVAYTRLVMGAHYLSDVTVGAVIAFSLTLAALAVYPKLVKEK